MGYRTKTPVPVEFGNASDGDLHITADALLTKAEYNLESLIIDEGVAWSVPVFSPGVFFPIVTIRCQRPIVLNGILSAMGVAWGWNTSGFTMSGEDSPGKDVTGDMMPVPVYPVCGGHCRGGESNTPTAWGNHFPYPNVTDGGYANGSTIIDPAQDLSELIGPERWFRYAIGTGGAIYHAYDAACTRDSHGGGAIMIYAPEIRFGANGQITANGGDGLYDTHDDGGGNGGGGGGYVELHTVVPVDGTYTWDKDEPVATGDKAKVTATGGSSTDSADNLVRDASNRAGYIGMAGVVSFNLIGGV